MKKLSERNKYTPTDAPQVGSNCDLSLNKCKDCDDILTNENWQKPNQKSHICICRKCNSNRYLKWQKIHREKYLQNQKNAKSKLKKLVIRHYGGQCVCCDEDKVIFLTIDHIHGGGNKYKQIIGIESSHQFYRWLKNVKYPSGFQVLCFNCNLGKNRYRICPHNKKDFKKIMDESYRIKNSINTVRKSIHRLRLKVIEGYGGKCKKCGEDNPYFLTIDHIFNDGNIERKQMNHQTLWRKLVRLNFPKEHHQLLCFNCNCSKNYL